MWADQTAGERCAVDEYLDGNPGHRPRGRATRTKIAVGVWCACVVVTLARWGVPQGRPELFLLITSGLIAASAGNPRVWAHVVRDWVPLFVILSLYDTLRGYAGQWLHVHVFLQIRFDQALFGQVPTVQLQHWLYTPGTAHWWDYLAFGVYMSHFVASFVVAGLLWKFAYPRFRRFAALFVGLTLLGFTTYALFPAAPPWLASQQGALAPTAKIIDEMWAHIGIRSGAQIFSATGKLANPVAAVPSIHAAYPLLLVLFFWQSAGRWRWLLPLYPLAMGFTLVYGAEHYVFDVLLGWLYAMGVYLIGTRLLDQWDRYQAQKMPTRSMTPTAIAHLETAR